MNIFELYKDKINKILLDMSKNGKIILPDKLDGINTEIPPPKFTDGVRHRPPRDERKRVLSAPWWRLPG